jgi:methionyl-tRNA formyltransferase
MGVIYRECLIESFSRGILNTSHIGRLPDYRGRSVFEWTLPFGERPTITTFFIDIGIDTGSPILSREKLISASSRRFRRSKNTCSSRTQTRTGNHPGTADRFGI